MSDKDKYKKMALKALASKAIMPNVISESRVSYEDGHEERMDEVLAQQLRERTTSLGNHPIFPDSDESHFEEKLMSKRFADVVKAFKRHHGTEKIDLMELYKSQMESLTQTMNLEVKHKEKLEAMAINLVREEFNMDESDVEIIANLTTEPTISSEGMSENPTEDSDLEFDNHEELQQANAEVYKRRFINALIQGSAKKTNHMFHMIDEELEELEPLLPSNYAKLMTGADYAYMVNNDQDTSRRMIGGKVQVEFPKVEGNRPKIIAEGMTLPVLIHEIVKGVMELMSAHGLPEDPKMSKYVLGKADYMAAETWDLRLGPVIWEKLVESIPAEDFALKHHVYVELVSLPVDEFNEVMREIMMGTRTGKAKVEEILNEVKDDLRNDEFDNAMEQISDDDYFNPEDLDNFTGEDWFM
jgi:hypothetical protein